MYGITVFRLRVICCFTPHSNLDLRDRYDLGVITLFVHLTDSTSGSRHG